MSEWTPENVPDNFYRVSVKALVLNETRDKFLIVEEEDGTWEVPGGGLDFGKTPHDDLAREITEEMGLEVRSVAEQPCYFTTKTKSAFGYWNVGVVYETELASLDFTPTDECLAIKFIGREDEEWLENTKVYGSVRALFKVFDPKHHQS